MTSRRLATGLAALALALGGGTIAGCSLGGDDDGQGGSLGLGGTKTQTTRVEVVEGQGAGKGFDSQAIFKNEGQGVVTVISLFGSGSLDSIAGGGGGGVGSGFVLNGDGEIATNAHVVTQGEGQRRPEGARGLRRVRRRQPRRGQDRRPGPQRRRGAAQDRPEGPDAAAAAARLERLGRRSASPWRRSARRSASASRCRSASISAIDRDIQSLNGEFAIPGAFQTDAAINPGNSGGPLVDGRRQGDRDQPADQDELGRRRGRRLRGPGRRHQALARRAARDRQRPLRLPRRLLGAAVPAARRPLRPRRRQGRVGAGGPARHARPTRPASAAAAATPASRSRATPRAATSSPRSRAR